MPAWATRRAASAMTPHQAWRAATRDAADKLGFLQDLGTVEAGKLADLVVLDADPLADIRNSTTLRWVIKNGEVFEASTLKALWPTEKALPKMFWEGELTVAGHNHEGAKARRRE